MINILFIGDIVGKIGRRAVVQILPKLKAEHKIDLVIANAENAAHGSGVSEAVVKELMDAGVNYLTTGDHAFKVERDFVVFDNYPIIRPANFPPGVPGQGFIVIDHQGKKILLINLIGRVFMSFDYDCPFRKLDEILANLNLPVDKLSAIIIDMHAEATSEKTAFKFYADGRATAVIGTHTHIMTADTQITDKGMAYITDVGMAGAAFGCIGVDKDGIIKTFLTQIKYQHVIPETGQAVFNSVLISVGAKGQAKKIMPITKFINIS